MSNADQSQLPSWFSLPAVGVFLAAVGGLYFLKPPATNNRPAVPRVATRPAFGAEVVDARLWEDPLLVAREYLNKRVRVDDDGVFFEPSVHRDAHRLSRLAKDLDLLLRHVEESAEDAEEPTDSDSARDVLVLPVLISGGDYAEDAERRRRTRHAVASALGRVHYVPRSADRMGFALTHWSRGPRGISDDAPSYMPEFDGQPVAPLALTLPVPYEWWEHDEHGHASDVSHARTVLVLWIDEGVTGAWSFEMIDSILGALLANARMDDERSYDVRIIGPSSSSTLLSITENVSDEVRRAPKRAATAPQERDTGREPSRVDLTGGGATPRERSMNEAGAPRSHDEAVEEWVGRLERELLEEGEFPFLVPGDPVWTSASEHILRRLNRSSSMAGLNPSDWPGRFAHASIGLDRLFLEFAAQQPDAWVDSVSLVSSISVWRDSILQGMEPERPTAREWRQALDVTYYIHTAWRPDDLLSSEEEWDVVARAYGGLRSGFDPLSAPGPPPIIFQLFEEQGPADGGEGWETPEYVARDWYDLQHGVDLERNEELEYEQASPGPHFLAALHWIADSAPTVRRDRALTLADDLIDVLSGYLDQRSQPLEEFDAGGGLSGIDGLRQQIAIWLLDAALRDEVAGSGDTDSYESLSTALRVEFVAKLEEWLPTVVDSVETWADVTTRSWLEGVEFDFQNEGMVWGRRLVHLADVVRLGRLYQSEGAKLPDSNARMPEDRSIEQWAFEFVAEVQDSSAATRPLTLNEKTELREAARRRFGAARVDGVGWVVPFTDESQGLLMELVSTLDFEFWGGESRLPAREVVSRWRGEVLGNAAPCSAHAVGARLFVELGEYLDVRQGVFDDGTVAGLEAAWIRDFAVFWRERIASPDTRFDPMTSNGRDALRELHREVSAWLETTVGPLTDSDPRWSQTVVDRWLDELRADAAREVAAFLVGSTGARDDAPTTRSDPQSRTRSLLPLVDVFSPRATTAPAILLAASRDRDSHDAGHAVEPAHQQETRENAEHRTAQEELARRITAFLRGGAKPTVRHLPDKVDRLQFHSTTATDDQLAWELAVELELRGVDFVDDTRRIVLIGEWDSLYGRSLPLSIAGAVLHRRNGHRTSQGLDESIQRVLELDEGDRLFDKVRVFSYLRGLDGAVPGRDAERLAGGMDSSSGSSPSDPSSMEFWTQGVEEWRWPVGRSQLDYMVRLSERLSRLSQDLREEDHEICAIGVVGSDVYDKQLVLQSLRRQFPRAIFFTTDLDAQLLHESQYEWSRNLLVGSGYGLALADPIQGRIPPFRDGYQTSTYLSCLLALGGVEVRCSLGKHDDVRLERLGEFVGASEPLDSAQKTLVVQASSGLVPLTPSPRVFEVGRTGAYDLGVRELPGGDEHGVDAEEASERALEAEIRAFVHPPPPPQGPFVAFGEETYSVYGVTAGLVGLGVFLVSLFSRRAQAWIRDNCSRSAIRSPGYWVAALLSVALGYWLVDGAIRDVAAGSGEPLVFTEGISVWPTIFVRGAATMMAWFALVASLRAVEDNSSKIEMEFGLDAGGSPWPGAWRRCAARWRAVMAPAGGGWTKTVRFVGWVLREPRGLLREISIFRWPDTAASKSETIDVGKTWLEYRRRGHLSARIVRVSFPLALFLAFSALVFHLYGGVDAPTRGPLVAEVNRWVFYLAFASASVLAFFVVDATRLCSQLMERLGASRSKWPGRPVRALHDDCGVAAEQAREVLDVKLIGERTRTIGLLILSPFVVLFALMLARNTFFDAWVWGPSHVIVIGLLASLTLGCGVVLRRDAERARQNSLARLGSALLKAKGEGKLAVASQIEAIIEDVRSTTAGAFAPWSKLPVVRAVLIPFGGVGVLAFLEFLVTAGV